MFWAQIKRPGNLLKGFLIVEDWGLPHIQAYAYDGDGGKFVDALKRTEVTDSNLGRIDFGSVAALTFAAGGAMGEAGRIEFSTADGSWYHLNCLHGPVSIQQFHRAFPSSPTNAPELPAHWRELPLGAGNCLYIHERAYQKYLEGHDAADPEDVLLWWRSVLGKPLLTKEERYAWLVEEAKSSYPQTPAQKDGLIWCGRCRDEINLWTYWQGRGCLSPEILVVGQDWGNPETAVGRQCLRNIENRRPYLENNSFPSDKNLAILFEQAFNMDIGKPDGRLFFTNLVLGCRSRGRWKAPSPTGEKGQAFAHQDRQGAALPVPGLYRPKGKVRAATRGL